MGFDENLRNLLFICTYIDSTGTKLNLCLLFFLRKYVKFRTRTRTIIMSISEELCSKYFPMLSIVLA